MNTDVQKIIKYPQILRLFLKYPERRFTPLELSKIARIPYPTARRYVLLLGKAGIADIERVGAYNVCRLNAGSPLIPEIKKVLQSELSPHKHAIREFADNLKQIKEIKRAILFGSVAGGKETLSSDIDIAVIAEKKSGALEKKIIMLSGKILDKSRMRIVPILLTETEARETPQFREELKKGVVVYERHKRIRILA
ncbi:MAG: nucleotidyltransferase domain-containing protein [Nanoarchaeota archaeon]|nr:nucleotidyltransferase domain-containing protein [Nanoarchaeota archaeon]MBU4300849.1 nucleotidyltransferase domain-containing protein [Nanoarchaeota archaeon]MBU4451550.1 nucleotidyltransferase domain-containing protein [Nanoarchaeota archaeon]MCG2724481.1 nucleotidyltransferase domain-containing protein [archaeon]